MVAIGPSTLTTTIVIAVEGAAMNYKSCARCHYDNVVDNDDTGPVCETCGVVAVGDYWHREVPEDSDSETT
jgi:hypothetical protein